MSTQVLELQPELKLDIKLSGMGRKISWISMRCDFLTQDKSKIIKILKDFVNGLYNTILIIIPKLSQWFK